MHGTASLSIERPGRKADGSAADTSTIPAAAATTPIPVEPKPVAAPSPRPAAVQRAEALQISVHQDIAALEGPWRDLEARAVGSVHQSHDWCRSWAEATGAELAVVTGSLGSGRLAFLLPLEIVGRAGMRIARFCATAESNLNFVLQDASIVPPADLDRQVAAALRASSLGIDCVVLEKVPSAFEGIPFPLAQLTETENQNRAFQLTLDPSLEKVLAQTNAKRRRKKVRVSERRIEAIGGYDYVIGETPAEAAAMLDVFFAQKAARFREQGLPDVFADPAVKAFFHRLAAVPPSADGSRPMEMHGIRLKGAHDGEYAAVSSLSIRGGHIICQFGSIHATLAADASPGELLFYRMIERACRQGRTVFDFGIGDQPYKRSWCNVERIHYDHVMPLSLKGRLYGHLHMARVAATRRLKQDPRLRPLADRLRRLVAARNGHSATPAEGGSADES